MEELIGSSIDEIVEFNFTDCFIPGKALKHIPKILKYDDKLMKIYDLATVGMLTIASIGMYYCGYKVIAH